MAMENNNISDRGCGIWRLRTYNPEEWFGPYEGKLLVTKDWHIVASVDAQPITLAEFPNGNVAVVENDLSKK